MDTADQLLRLINGYRVSQAIHVAAELRLSDHLADGPRTITELARASESDPDTLHRLLRALATVGLYSELPDGRFESTPLGEELRSDAPRGLRGLAVFIGRPYFWQVWSALEHSVRTGENAFAVVHGQSAWEYRASRPEESEIFDAAMTSMSRYLQAALLDAYDFGAFGTIADIAGGRGALLAALLTRYPAMRGVLFDQPHVIEGAPALLTRAGVADRCQIVGGDMFESVPGDADALVLKAIIHDWPDEPSIAILRRCREAMRPDAVLLVLERVIADPPHTGDGAMTALSDLNMLVGPGGRERTGPEYAALLGKAGFELTRVVPTASDVQVIEARPAPGS
jgi:hypothetical protein